MLILMQFWGFGAKNQGGGGGGWSNSQGKNRRAGLLCRLELFGSLFNTAKFIQIGEMACITPAWSSGKLGLNSLHDL